MFKNKNKQNEKCNLYKPCNCKIKHNNNGNKKQTNSYESIKENVTHEVPLQAYRK
jgi:hypothetical protein